MMDENKEEQATPEYDELRVMLHEMINAPIREYISAIDKHLDETFQAVSKDTMEIKALMKSAKKEAANSHGDFVEKTEDAWKRQQEWEEEARLRLDAASELAKGNASSMNSTVKRHGQILAFVLVLAALNTLAAAALLWLVYSR